MPTFEIILDKNGFFRFNLIGNRRELLLKSEAYTTLNACENGVSSVMRNGKQRENYDFKETSNLKHYLVLKAANGQVIAVSNFVSTKDILKDLLSQIIEILSEGVKVNQFNK